MMTCLGRQRPGPALARAACSLRLAAGCTQEAKGGVGYQKCGNVYYRAAFHGHNPV